MITLQQAQTVLSQLAARNLNFSSPGQAHVWAQDINARYPDAAIGDLMAAVHQVVTDRMATRSTRAVTVAELLAAIHDVTDGTTEQRRARLTAEISRHGTFLPAGLGAEPAIEAQWRDAAQRAFMGGMSRQDAETSAWTVIGRTPPPEIESARGRDDDTPVGLTGPDLARETLRRVGERARRDHGTPRATPAMAWLRDL